MASLFDRLAREEAAVRGEVAMLHQRLEEAEERLRHLTITRKTLESLPEDEAEVPDGPEGEKPEEPEEPPVTEKAAQSELEALPGSAGPLEWEEGRRRMLSLLATAKRAMKAKAIAEAVGEDVTTPARVETTRARLKRLVEEGQVIEEPVGSFAIATGTRGESAVVG
ncbi:hypothetical protein ITI46_16980 [Streptomyces oryzae]|uniref:Uncharacterized protein n=1 Tax=Streptomyces oryzae TaxID=1434886 RepID=A0ABS3XD92_9ACTN|nr:hypothetical protein [Streptomyces oryzae]MBO8193345.1 hypothetical protein [Streptomyces oryzae]